MFLKMCVFSVSSSNIYIYNDKGIEIMRKQVAVEVFVERLSEEIVFSTVFSE